MYLLIDSSNPDEFILSLFKKKDQILIQRTKIKNYLSEILLKEFAKFVKRFKINLFEIKGILVIRGPGYFTSLRLGVLFGNVLSFFLKIPLVGIKKEDKKIKDYFKKNISHLRHLKGPRIVSPFY